MDEITLDARRTIVRHALLVLFAGMIGGFAWAFSLLGEVRLSPIPITFFENFPGAPDRWRPTHTGCFMNAILALVLAANLDLFNMDEGLAKKLKLGVPLILWGNTVFYFFGVFAPNRGLSLGDNVQGAGNLSGAMAYSGAFIALVALIYLTAILVLKLGSKRT